MHRVTVIIPTRNRPLFLRQAVDSVLRQTHPVHQIIICDDGSDSPDWLLPLKGLSPTIDVIFGETCQGVSAARNKGLEKAHGDYILFLDDDDLIDSRFVERGLAVHHSNPEIDVVFFRYQVIEVDTSISEDMSTFIDLPLLSNRQTSGEEFVPRDILEQRPATAFIRYLVPIHSGFIRRSAIGTIRYHKSLRQGEDTHFWISLANSGCRFVVDDHEYAIIRRHLHNTTRSRFRYMREIQACYEQLLAEGLLCDQNDIFLAHLKLFCFKMITGNQQISRHLKNIATSPRLLASEFRFWIAKLFSRVWTW